MSCYKDHRICCYELGKKALPTYQRGLLALCLWIVLNGHSPFLGTIDTLVLVQD